MVRTFINHVSAMSSRKMPSPSRISAGALYVGGGIDERPSPCTTSSRCATGPSIGSRSRKSPPALMLGHRRPVSSASLGAWIGVSELPDNAHWRSNASLEAWNAALQASSGSPQASGCATEVRSLSVLVTSGTLQVRARPLPASRRGAGTAAPPIRLTKSLSHQS